jgi:quinol monooxygenase YgiN
VDNQLHPGYVPYCLLQEEKFMSVLTMVKMTAFPKKRTELLQTLETLKNSTCQADSGCAEYRFYQEGENENSLILILEWQTQEKLAAYQNSDQYKILMGAISLLCESSEISTGAVPIETRHRYALPLS